MNYESLIELIKLKGYSVTDFSELLSMSRQNIYDLKKKLEVPLYIQEIAIRELPSLHRNFYKYTVIAKLIEIKAHIIILNNNELEYSISQNITPFSLKIEDYEHNINRVKILNDITILPFNEYLVNEFFNTMILNKSQNLSDNKLRESLQEYLNNTNLISKIFYEKYEFKANKKEQEKEKKYIFKLTEKQYKKLTDNAKNMKLSTNDYLKTLIENL